jgi:GxxExxY protein
MGVILPPEIPGEIENIGSRCIGCGIAVHRILGPGYRELIYQRAYCLELEEQGLKFEAEKRVLVPYKERLIDGHTLDLIVEGCVVIELKAVPVVKNVHRLQVLSYLKATSLRLGYLMNFSDETFMKGVKRVVL